MKQVVQTDDWDSVVEQMHRELEGITLKDIRLKHDINMSDVATEASLSLATVHQVDLGLASKQVVKTVRRAHVVLLMRKRRALEDAPTVALPVIDRRPIHPVRLQSYLK